ncbi:hypothetical protein ACOTZP_21005 [Enterobacter cloacae complex sp. SYL001]|uniref:hypothetical protein n=1 Tax=Enterobacter cloacae complex sp. SYL001 TaxID=3412404 RepID=UPI002FD2998A
MMAKINSVLFICPNFFDYKKLIEEELSKHFDKLYSFSDRPVCSSISKALFKYNFPIYSSRLSEKYCRDIYDSIADDLSSISEVIIIKGTCITPSFLQKLRSSNYNINITTYTWDSISNIKTFITLSKLSNHTYTFDLKDSQKYKIPYLPLFYNSSHHDEKHIHDIKAIFDYCFIGSYHGDRVNVLSRFLGPKKSIRHYVKIYFQSRLQYIIYYLLNPALRSCPKEWVTFKPISRKKLEEITAVSHYTIDIHHQKQTGLTMRTWETLQSNSKLVTTNPTVLAHINSHNVTVIDRDTGLEWSIEQCEKYIKNLISEDERVKISGCLSLSEWVDVLLTKG